MRINHIKTHNNQWRGTGACAWIEWGQDHRDVGAGPHGNWAQMVLGVGAFVGN